MNRERRRFRIVSTLAAILCAVTFGCQGSPAPSADASPDPTTDEQVLRALDCYEPMYQVDVNGRVTHLHLQWRHLPGPVLDEIDKLTELEFLDVGNTTLTDEGLAQLKDLQKLTTLSLAGSQITDKGLRWLEKLRSLHQIWVSKNRVSETAVEQLKEARPDLAVYLL
jgi:Leucine-rich repeat (LRR) protein